MLTKFLVLFAALAIAACSATNDRKGSADDTDAGTDGGLGGSDGDSDGDLDAGDGGDLVPGCTKMDILFVIDDSLSMDCEQSQLGQAFPGFIQVLENYQTPAGTQVEYRVGVTSTGRTLNYTITVLGTSIPQHEIGMDGDLAQVPGGGRWIDGPGPSVAAEFSQAASLGTGGPTYEMPLECMREALQKDAAGKTNEGFLREDALFIVVVITDEDDCSRTDNDFDIPNDSCMANPIKHNLVALEEFKQYLDDRFGGSDRYVTVAIAGAQDCDSSSVTCSGDDTAYSGAFEAVRLKDFITNYMTENGVFSDICTEALPNALSRALETMTVACDEFVPVE